MLPGIGDSLVRLMRNTQERKHWLEWTEKECHARSMTAETLYWDVCGAVRYLACIALLPLVSREVC